MALNSDTVRTLLHRKPATTRNGQTRKVTVGGHEMYVTVNYYDDNDQPCEVFVSMAKAGSTLNGLMDMAAILLSLMLQSGMPLSIATDKMLATKFEPSDDQYSSLADALAKSLLSMVSERGGNPDHDCHGQPVTWA